VRAPLSTARDGAYSPWARAAAIALRTAHLGAMALLVGAQHFAAPEASLRLWRLLTAATGVALLVSEISHSRNWLHQARGVIALAHVAVLASVLVWGGLGRSATLVALAIGSIGSHLPRAVRKWSLLHRSVLD
jgi:hypothetical protein